MKTLREKCMDDVRRFFVTGELPDAWTVDEAEFDRSELVSDAELDRRVDEINRELEAAIESGCIDSDDPRHPNHPITCVRPCCARREL